METVLVGVFVALMLLFPNHPKPRAHANPELVVVVPSADGHVGTVVVERDGERVVLNEAYASSRIAGTNGPELTRLPEQEVRASFVDTLAALPTRPMSFLLYFITGTDILTEDSKIELARMLDELRSRPVGDIFVIGHTDRVGSVEDNDRLSLLRAERVKADLVSQGAAEEHRVRAAGRGEREPIVQTDDGVDEPRNRRVEISVR